jgi:hypothetical protein
VLFFVQLPVAIVAETPEWKTGRWQLSTACHIIRFSHEFTYLQAFLSINRGHSQQLEEFHLTPKIRIAG